MESIPEINPHVAAKETPKEACAVVARFPELSGEMADKVTAHMDDALDGVRAYEGIMPLTDEEKQKASAVGETAVKAMFGSIYVAAAERYTAMAAREAGEKESVRVVGLLVQPTVMTEQLQNWARLRAASQIGPMM